MSNYDGLQYYHGWELRFEPTGWQYHCLSKPNPLDYWKVFLEKHVTVPPATQLATPPATQLAIPIVTQLAIPIVTQLATLPATPDVITHRLVGSSVAIRTEVVESLEN